MIYIISDTSIISKIISDLLFNNIYEIFLSIRAKWELFKNFQISYQVSDHSRTNERLISKYAVHLV